MDRVGTHRPSSNGVWDEGQGVGHGGGVEWKDRVDGDGHLRRIEGRREGGKEGGFKLVVCTVLFFSRSSDHALVEESLGVVNNDADVVK